MVLVSKTEIIVPDDVGKDKKKISDWGPITPYMEKMHGKMRRGLLWKCLYRRSRVLKIGW